MPSIRNIAVALPTKDEHVLVQRGYDAVKDQHFYRALGGGIEFGERAADALRREFQEELGIKIDRIELLTVIENIFTYEGAAGHEVVHVFTADSSEFDNMSVEATLPILDEPDSSAQWIPVNTLLTGEPPLYPEGATRLLPIKDTPIQNPR